MLLSFCFVIEESMSAHSRSITATIWAFSSINETRMTLWRRWTCWSWWRTSCERKDGSFCDSNRMRKGLKPTSSGESDSSSAELLKAWVWTRTTDFHSWIRAILVKEWKSEKENPSRNVCDNIVGNLWSMICCMDMTNGRITIHERSDRRSELSTVHSQLWLNLKTLIGWILNDRISQRSDAHRSRVRYVGLRH